MAQKKKRVRRTREQIEADNARVAGVEEEMSVGGFNEVGPSVVAQEKSEVVGKKFDELMKNCRVRVRVKQESMSDPANPGALYVDFDDFKDAVEDYFAEEGHDVKIRKHHHSRGRIWMWQ